MTRQRQPINRTAMKRSAPPRKRAKPRKVLVLRDCGYLDYLKTMPCTINGWFCWMRVDPAHGPVNGMRSKGGDDGAISLCRFHHEEQHRIGWPAFEAKYGFSREVEAKVFWAAYQVWKE